MKWKRVVLGFFLLLVFVSAGFVIWGSTPAKPMPEASQALQSDARVTVEQGNWIVFQPTQGVTDTGLIFYPGGRVDYRAYAPQARAIAEQGYLVVIVKMPLNLAVLGADRAEGVVSAFSNIKHWAIGGHSLGGSMAARYTLNHPDSIDGLVLWASYPAQTDGLADRKILTTSIYGSNDGLATGSKIDASRPLLPSSTAWVKIEGGNHAQFGWYGPQSGDQPAEIDRLSQQNQVVAATVQLLEKLQAGQ